MEKWCDYITDTTSGMTCGLPGHANYERCTKHLGMKQREVRRKAKRLSGYSQFQAEIGGFQLSSRA